MDKDNGAIAGANESMETNLVKNEPSIFASYGLVGAILLFGAVGYLLDKSFDTSPWLVLCGFLVGVAVGFFGLVKAVRQR